MANDEDLDPAEQLRADIESAIEQQQPSESEDAGQSDETEQDTESAAPESGRDKKGRFVAKTPKDGEGEQVEALGEPEGTKDEAPATEEPKSIVRPPPGFSVASKAIWDTLPQSVRDDIAKREQEVDAGFKRYGGLGKFAEEAERNGTTLQNAVADYDAIEKELRKDPVTGVEFLFRKMGENPVNILKAWLSRYVPQKDAQGQPQQTQVQPPQPQVDPAAIAQHVAQMLRTEAQSRDLNSQIEAAKIDPSKPFFANVRPLMSRIVQAGKPDGTEYDLQEAYDAACWLTPEIRTILINESNGGANREASKVAARSRAAAKAVGGSPTPGVNPDATSRRKDLSLEDEIRANVDAQIGAA